jgi:recombination protein RecA
MAAKRKAASSDAVLSAVHEKHGQDSVIRLGAGVFESVEKTSSGSLALDRALGGGYARGRIIETFGVESSGKTTLALHAIAEIQRIDEQAAFIDAEHALDPQYAKALGVDVDRLLFAQPQSGEQALDIVGSLAETGEVSLIVIDSVAALTPLAEMEGDMAQQHVGVQARMMSKALRKLCSVANQKRCTLLFLNQIRMKIGVMYGNPETTPGGNALKFFASQRLDVRRREHVKEGDKAVANRVAIKVVKNKVAPPFGEAALTIRWGHGIDKAADVLEVAVELGTVVKAGNWYKWGEQNIGQGLQNTAVALAAAPELLVEIERSTREKAGIV